MIDGTSLSGTWWFFYGALSDVEYEVTVTDNETGITRIYQNEQGSICGDADTGSFLDQLPE